MYSFTLSVTFWASEVIDGQKKLKKQPIHVPSCHRSTTVRELKAHVASVLGVVVNLVLQQRTADGAAKGKILDDDNCTLCDLGIDNPESFIAVYAVRKPGRSSTAKWQSALDALEHQGLQHQRSGGDGNCLFRSVSKLVYGTEDHHAVVRQCCMDYMVVQVHAFEPMTVSDLHQGGFQDYIAMKRKTDGSVSSYGDEPELLAMSELYRRPVQVWTPDDTDDSETQWRVVRTYSQSLQSEPIRVCFLGQGHYDALVPLGAPAEPMGAPAEGAAVYLDLEKYGSFPGKYEKYVIEQVNDRTPEELAAIDSERASYRQLLNGGNLEQSIPEQVRQESLSQLRQEASRELNQAVDESLQVEFQRETDAALDASQRDAEGLMENAMQQSIEDEEQRRLDIASNASAADQQQRNEDAMEKARRDSIKDKVKRDLMQMGIESYVAEYAAESNEDVETALAFLQQQQSGGDLTPTSRQQQEQAADQTLEQAKRDSIQSQIVADMVSMGYEEWLAQFAAKDANDLEGAIAIASQMM